MDSNQSKKLLAGSALCLSFFAALFAGVLLSKLPLLHFSATNQLAQIISIETDLLKKWQQNGSLKNNLAYSAEGTEVILLQRMLSQDETAYPERKITGYYGDLTRTAVKNFQKEQGLEQNGTVDTDTRQKLNAIFFSHLCPEPIAVYPDFLMKKIGTSTPLSLDYVPPNLEDISAKIRTSSVACLRTDIVPYLVRMFADASRDKVELMVTSGYRRPEIQKYLYDFWIQTHGDAAIHEIAKPGLSEHQLGTTVDLTDSSIQFAGVDTRFANSRGGNWLRAHAHEYGFTMSFKEGTQDVTGFIYEPWHWRFVGVDAATTLYTLNLAYAQTTLYASKPHTFPSPKDTAKNLTLTAQSFVSVFVDARGAENVLVEKNADIELPIASITKLLVALVAVDQYKNNDRVSISESSLSTKGLSGVYRAGDSFLFSDALHALLVASHNEIASALAARVGTDTFLKMMRQKALALGLSRTTFANVTGLDPAVGSEQINRSTVFDIYRLGRHIEKNRPELLAITRQKTVALFAVDGRFVTTLNTTDTLLTRQNIPFPILGGKTGETPRAKQNILIVSEGPCGGKIFSVVLGSQNSFEDMEKLLYYVRDSYMWSCSF